MGQNKPVEARLVILKGARRGEKFTLTEDAPYVIGRGSQCSLQLIDRGLSRNHLRIEYGAAGFVATDLESSNGTFVNGVEISSVSMTDGDIITVGETEMKFNQVKEQEDRRLSELPLRPALKQCRHHAEEDADAKVTRQASCPPSQRRAREPQPPNPDRREDGKTWPSELGNGE